jgi:hypothetical protein
LWKIRLAQLIIFLIVQKYLPLFNAYFNGIKKIIVDPINVRFFDKAKNFHKLGVKIHLFKNFKHFVKSFINEQLLQKRERNRKVFCGW